MVEKSCPSRGYLPYGSGDVDESVSLVQDGKSVLVAMHEPLLDLPLMQWKEKAQRAVLLSLQDSDTMLLCHIPDATLCKESLRSDRGEAVKGVVDDPVEHLVQKGKALKDAAVDVVAEA